MASPQAKSRYAAALRDPQSPTERGRFKVLGSTGGSPTTANLPPPSPEASRDKSRIASRWQAAAQQRFINTTMPETKPSAPNPFTVTSPLPVQPSRIKKSWDAEKEIPPGTVSSSPFKPTPAPLPPPPPPPAALRLQKNQWDAKRDIPKGTVLQARQTRAAADRQNNESAESVENLKKAQWNADRDIPKGTVTAKKQDETWNSRTGSTPLSPESSKLYTNSSPRIWESGGAEPDVKAIDSPKRLWDAENEIPKGVVNKAKSNGIFFAEGSDSDPKAPPHVTPQKKQWNPSDDIPLGKVKGISNMFTSGNVKKEDAPDNHIQPLDPPDPSPANLYTSELIKPTPILAARSDDEIMPPTKQKQKPLKQDAQSNSAFVASNDDAAAADNDVWSIPQTSSGALFGKGTWGELANPSLSNDDYDDQDWFQAGSFAEGEEKKENSDQNLGASVRDVIDARNAFPSPPSVPENLDDDDDEAPDAAENIGSFAAAIQPVTSSRMPAKPETVAEEPDEDEGGSYETTPPASDTTPVSHVKSAASKFFKRKSKNVAEEESSNARQLQMLLDRKDDNEPQTSDGRSVGSKTSKTSKGTLLGFRKKSDATEKDEGSDKRRLGGIFKIFSRKDHSRKEESSELVKPGSKSSDVTALRQSIMSTPRATNTVISETAVPKRESEPLTTIDSRGSLQKLTEDLDKLRAKGIINTQDDMTAVSEMTNPTVFLKQVPSDSMEEKIKIANSKLAVKKSREKTEEIASEWPSFTDDMAPTGDNATQKSLSSAADPFDLNAPIFSNGDPFASSKEFASVHVSTIDDPFSDPFFDMLQNDLSSGTFSVDNPASDGNEQVSNDENAPFALGSGRTESAVSSSLKPDSTSDNGKFSFDVPDPEIELLSSDDEPENDDTAARNEAQNIVPGSDEIRGDHNEQRLMTGIAEAPMDEYAEVSASASSSFPGKGTAPESKAARRLDRFKTHQFGVAKLTPSAESGGIASGTGETVSRSETKPSFAPSATHSKKISLRGPAPETFLSRAMGPVDNLERGLPPTKSSDSTDDDTWKPSNGGRSQLSNKMRAKQFEKKMHKAMLIEQAQGLPPPPTPPPPPPPPNPSEHVSTSAYLNRFKPKVQVQRSPAQTDASQPTAGTRDFAVSTSVSEDTESDKIQAIESVDSHMSSGSRSGRRTLRSKAKQNDSPLPFDPRATAASKKTPLQEPKPFPVSKKAPSNEILGVTKKTAISSLRNNPSSTVTSASHGPSQQVKPAVSRRTTSSTSFSKPTLDVSSTRDVVAGYPTTISSLQQQAQPRSILKKPTLGIPAQRKAPDQTAEQFSIYDETQISDPMHRAGLRLLSAAVIPIQSEMRRFLAKREALNRMWGIIVIQACVRRWIVLRQIDREDEAALVIQAAFADYLTREYARVLIQAHVRRWLVQKAMREMFAATLIQAQFRRWILERAYQEHKAVLCVQKNVKMWLVRKEYVKVISAIKIQKCTRGMISYKNFWLQVLAAIQIQAIFRGWLARDLLEDQHYCATQIQRIYRGYKATMSVYDDIYRVTLVQSVVRMKIAVETATNKLAVIIQTQSIIRGYLVRKRLTALNSNAVVIQRHWRGYSMRLNYGFTLLDIILIQSLCRQKIAKKKLVALQQERRVRCATIIQAQWRCYDCTMNYLHYLADVLILQSAVRRWIAYKHVQEVREERDINSAKVIQSHARGFLVRKGVKRNKAALTIQKTWRGFVAYAEYMFTIADIVAAQAQLRCWMARRKVKHLAAKRDEKASTAIQTQWRGFVARTVKFGFILNVIICQSAARRLLAKIRFRRALLEKDSALAIQRSWLAYIVRRDEKVAATSIQRISRGLLQRKKYAVALEEHYASVKIQSLWRRFWLFSNFIITLDSIIVVQSVVRSHLTRNDMRKKASKATLIQAKQRSINARRIASAKSMVKALFSASSAIVEKEVDSALMIQTSFRGYAARSALFHHRKALVIQTNWRGVIPRRALHQFKSALLVQKLWRRHVLFTSYNQYRSAKRVQTLWRGFIVRTWYTRFLRARKIQTVWRMAVARSAYSRYQGAKKIQACWRCYSAREKFVQWLVTVEAATMIQSAWRSFVCYTDFIFTLADIVTVQRRVRGYNHRKLFARKCEERQQAIFEENQRQASAANIQRVFRGAQARSEVALLKHYLAERKRKDDAAAAIQAAWRRYNLKQRYWYLLGCTIQIQSVVRGIIARRRYAYDFGSIILVQSIARRWFMIRNFRQIRLIDFLLKAAKREKLEKDEAAKTLQLWYKVWIKPRPMILATIKIQSFFRMVRAMVDREVMAEKQRRRRRKKEKRSKPKTSVDDALLDAAWESMSVPVEEQKEAKNDALAVAGKLDRAQSIERQGRQDDSCGRNTTRSKSRDATAVKTPLVPPKYYADEDGSFENELPPARMVRLGRAVDDSDAMSEVSGLTAPTVFRAAPSRLENMGDKEMAADLSLEEAWVDMEIQNVKNKQKTMAKGRKHRWAGVKANLKT